MHLKFLIEDIKWSARRPWSRWA